MEKLAADPSTGALRATAAYRAAAKQAAACAVEVMSLDGQKVTGGGVTEVLRLKCGIGLGNMLGMTVGSTGPASDGRFEYVVGGDPLPQITLTDAAAEPGQVLLAPEAWAVLVEDGPGAVTGEHLDNGCILLGTVGGAGYGEVEVAGGGGGGGPARGRSSTRMLKSSRSSDRMGSSRDTAELRADLLHQLQESGDEKVHRVLTGILEHFIPASVQQMFGVGSLQATQQMQTHWAATLRVVTIMFVRLDEAGQPSAPQELLQVRAQLTAQRLAAYTRAHLRVRNPDLRLASNSVRCGTGSG